MSMFSHRNHIQTDLLCDSRQCKSFLVASAASIIVRVRSRTDWWRMGDLIIGYFREENDTMSKCIPILKCEFLLGPVISLWCSTLVTTVALF